MRTNKFIPFGLALLIHLIPLIFILFKKPMAITPLINSSARDSFSERGIDLNGFSISEKVVKPPQNFASRQDAKSQKPIKTVGLSSSNVIYDEKQSGYSSDLKPSSGTIGNGAGPIFIKFQEPSYPLLARKKGFEGKVKIKAFFNIDGLITKVDIIESSGIALLDETVTRAAFNWKLKSADSGSFEKVFEFKLKN